MAKSMQIFCVQFAVLGLFPLRNVLIQSSQLKVSMQELDIDRIDLNNLLSYCSTALDKNPCDIS